MLAARVELSPKLQMAFAKWVSPEEGARCEFKLFRSTTFCGPWFSCLYFPLLNENALIIGTERVDRRAYITPILNAIHFAMQKCMYRSVPNCMLVHYMYSIQEFF